MALKWRENDVEINMSLKGAKSALNRDYVGVTLRLNHDKMALK